MVPRELKPGGWVADSSGEMTTIRTTCPRCGEVDMGPQAILLSVRQNGREGSYRFTCPSCSDDVEKRADRKIVALLVSAGVDIDQGEGASIEHPGLFDDDDEDEEADPAARCPTAPRSPSTTSSSSTTSWRTTVTSASSWPPATASEHAAPEPGREPSSPAARVASPREHLDPRLVHRGRREHVVGAPVRRVVWCATSSCSGGPRVRCRTRSSPSWRRCPVRGSGRPRAPRRCNPRVARGRS